ncbi:hypothetical protein OT109_08640 [Phycisphaeraceae bacterium D3-23]
MAWDVSAYLDESGAVSPGVRCTNCRYDLRGRAPESDCPECGRPILPDLETQVMRDEDPGEPTHLLPIGLTLLPVLPLLAYWINTLLLGNDDGLAVFSAMLYAALGALAAAQVSLLGCFYSVYWGKALFGLFFCLALIYFGVLVAVVGVVLVF